jgi:hypothetical protein
MASTEAQLPSIVRTLNTITTAGQTRSAIGAALVALHEGYAVAKMIDDDKRRAAAENELNQARIALERWIRLIVPTGPQPFQQEWQKNRHLVERAYIVIAGVEGAAEYTPRTSNWEILRESVKEGMGTVTTVIKEAAATAGEVVGAAAGAAGKGAGSLLGGLFSGLGASGLIHLVLIGAVVLVVVKRTTVLGKLGSAIGKAAA